MHANMSACVGRPEANGYLPHHSSNLLGFSRHGLTLSQVHLFSISGWAESTKRPHVLTSLTLGLKEETSPLRDFPDPSDQPFASHVNNTNLACRLRISRSLSLYVIYSYRGGHDFEKRYGGTGKELEKKGQM